MFDRLQKPFLTVETGEAYQPIRLSYHVHQKDGLIKLLESLSCIQKNSRPDAWTWYWKAECDSIHFESLDSYRKNSEQPLRLGTISIRDNILSVNLPSFKRACLTIPFFDRIILHHLGRIHRADFINKVFAIDERLPHGFAELLDENELERVVYEREIEYHRIQEECALAPSAEKALVILSEYTKAEARKALPYAERYVFEPGEGDPEVMFLGFYIFLRGREVVAIKRWYGETNYTLADMVEETIEQVFGGVGLDIIE